jgi:hypothetical protein
MKKRLYTTSEYLDALKLAIKFKAYHCRGKEFVFFSTFAAADYDAQWFADWHKRQGIRKRKPTVYRIRLEKVSK